MSNGLRHKNQVELKKHSDSTKGYRDYRGVFEDDGNGRMVRFYYATFDKAKSLKLKPSIPSTWMVKNGFEDDKIKRIPVYESIDGCLTAFSKSLAGTTVYIHTVDAPIKNVITNKTITQEGWSNSAQLTKMVWIVDIEEVESDYALTVRVSAARDKPLIYTYGDSNEYKDELYAWRYQVIDEMKAESFSGASAMPYLKPESITSFGEISIFDTLNQPQLSHNHMVFSHKYVDGVGGDHAKVVFGCRDMNKSLLASGEIKAGEFSCTGDKMFTDKLKNYVEKLCDWYGVKQDGIVDKVKGHSGARKYGICLAKLKEITNVKDGLESLFNKIGTDMLANFNTKRMLAESISCGSGEEISYETTHIDIEDLFVEANLTNVKWFNRLSNLKARKTGMPDNFGKSNITNARLKTVYEDLYTNYKSKIKSLVDKCVNSLPKDVAKAFIPMNINKTVHDSVEINNNQIVLDILDYDIWRISKDADKIFKIDDEVHEKLREEFNEAWTEITNMCIAVTAKLNKMYPDIGFVFMDYADSWDNGRFTILSAKSNGDVFNYSESIVTDSFDTPTVKMASRKRLYPIYVIFSNSEYVLSKAIRFFTRSEFSHVSISTRGLSELVSFGHTSRNRGLVLENIYEFIEIRKPESIRIQALLVDQNTYIKINKNIERFRRSISKYDYSYSDLIKYPLLPKKVVPNTDKVDFFCSQYVSWLLTNINDMDGKPVIDNINISPARLLSRLNKTITVYSGKAEHFSMDVLERFEKGLKIEPHRTNILQKITMERNGLVDRRGEEFFLETQHIDVNEDSLLLKGDFSPTNSVEEIVRCLNKNLRVKGSISNNNQLVNGRVNLLYNTLA
ncbi:MAG: hypothetical protein ACRC92_17295 [Peptostreptococcaceae bacterium]